MSNPNQLSIMETTEVKKASRKVQHNPKPCANPLCGKEFTPKNKTGLYCSPSCNAKASAMRLANRLSPNQTQPAFAGLGALGGVYAIPPHADMMIKHHEKEATRWEEKYKEEVKEHKATITELNAVKAQANEEKRPGGLEGFAERNPAIAEKLLDFGLSMADKFGSKMIQPGHPGEPAQVMEGVSGPSGAIARQFGDWFITLDEETQKAVWTLVTVLSKEDAEKMKYSIKAILQAWR